VVREWLTSLGVLSALSLPQHEAAQKLGAYVPMLMREFTDACFTAASLSYVARRVQYFPTFYELAQLLAEWGTDNLPRPRAIAPPAPPPEPEREPMTREALDRMHTLVAELAREWAAPPLYQRPAPTRHLTPDQLRKAYADAKITGPHGPAAAAPDASAAPIDPDSGADFAETGPDYA
jgi:hypothetical protein